MWPTNLSQQTGSFGWRLFTFFQFLLMAMFLAGGIYTLNSQNLLFNIGLIGIGAAGVIHIGYYWISPEPFPIAECDSKSTTLLLGSRTRRTLAFTVFALLFGGAVFAGGVQLALAHEYFWAVILGLFGAWILLGWRYYFAGRLAGGAIRLTPERISQHIDNREQGIDWADISHIMPTITRKGRLAVHLHARHPSQVTRTQHASRIFGIRSWPAPGIVELITSDMTVIGRDALTQVVDGYLSNPEARQRIGTPESLHDIDDFITFRYRGGHR